MLELDGKKHISVELRNLFTKLDYMEPKTLISNETLVWGNVISVGGGHTVGLKSDGALVAVGNNEYGQCNVGTWSDAMRCHRVSLEVVIHPLPTLSLCEQGSLEVEDFLPHDVK